MESGIQFKYKYEATRVNEGCEIVMKLGPHLDLPTLIENFERFIRAIGYYPHGTLEYVCDEADPAAYEEVIAGLREEIRDLKSPNAEAILEAEDKGFVGRSFTEYLQATNSDGECQDGYCCGECK